MARDTVDERPLESVDEMIQWFAQGCKPKEDWRIGTEHEKFAFYTDSHGPVPYDGDRGIEALLKGMQAELGWEAITDDGRIIGLAGGDGEGAISIEPGGQFELSGAPLETIHQTCAESNRHLRAVKAVGKALGMGFLGLGSSPVWTEAQTPRMPKSRYKIMANYMPKVNKQVGEYYTLLLLCAAGMMIMGSAIFTAKHGTSMAMGIWITSELPTIPD